MCGRFSQYSSVQDLVTRFGVDESLVDATRRPRYNVAPTQPALIVAASRDGSTRKLGEMRWGLVPKWAKDVRIGNRMINARTDKVATSNAYRAAFAKRRCIVPVDGFYEWAKPPSGRNDAKTPFHIHTPDRAPFALAGLWELWNDAQGRPLRSFTILTCDANATMAPVHDRMPVILDEADWTVWLAPSPLEPDDRQRLLEPASDDVLVLDEVSTAVNKPVNDSADLIVPVQR